MEFSTLSYFDVEVGLNDIDNNLKSRPCTCMKHTPELSVKRNLNKDQAVGGL